MFSVTLHKTEQPFALKCRKYLGSFCSAALKTVLKIRDALKALPKTRFISRTCATSSQVRSNLGKQQSTTLNKAIKECHSWFFFILTFFTTESEQEDVMILTQIKNKREFPHDCCLHSVTGVKKKKKSQIRLKGKT